MADVYARRIVGWSIADHLRSELVVDALEMARWRRRPAPGQTVLHSGRGAQYTSWAFGHRLRDAGLLGSMGRVGSAYDDAMMESFLGTLQRELLDRRQWATRKELASAIFEWIEAWYDPRRRHTSIDNLSPLDYERLFTVTADAALSSRTKLSGKPGAGAKEEASRLLVERRPRALFSVAYHFDVTG